MSEQHWLFGPELLKALVAAEVVPPMTQRVEIVVDHDEFVVVRAEIALSTEQLLEVGALLPKREAR